MTEIFESGSLAQKILGDANGAIGGVGTAREALVKDLSGLSATELRILEMQFGQTNGLKGDYPWASALHDSCGQVVSFVFNKSFTGIKPITVDLTKTNGTNDPSTCEMEPLKRAE